MAKNNNKIQKQGISHLDTELEEDKIVQLSENNTDESVKDIKKDYSLNVDDSSTLQNEEFEVDKSNYGINKLDKDNSQDEQIDNQKNDDNKINEETKIGDNNNDNSNNNQKEQKITLSVILRTIVKKWWMFLFNCIIIGTISALLIIEEPRTYTTEVKLAPEAESDVAGGGLSSIASSFGIDLGGMTSLDAIRPDLYPDLVESNDFIYNLFKLPIKTSDGNIYTDYYTYLKKYQKFSWWRKAINDFMKKFQDKPKENKINGNLINGQDENKKRYLTADEEKMIETIKSNVTCSVDQKTFIITISATDQDPLVAAIVADSVRARIQNFITDYRTKKATKDYHYYLGLLKQAKEDYEKTCQAYARYVDSHRDVILQAYISERDQLENDMQLKLNTYNAMLTQTQNAKAKIQEQTPAFTILQNAFIPVKPTGPKRMLFVLGMVFLTFTFTLFILLGKVFINNLKA